ncbi:MAG: ATP-binding protein, partial [Actinomycetota bacterium]|nr:ATP-binding protein [Actinomycetota bacterium]
MSRSSYTIQTETAQQVVQGNQNKVVFGHDLHGAIVNLVEREPATPRRWPPPLQVRPPQFPMILDREHPAAEVMSGLGAGLPVEIVGPAGVGKTTLLRHLCWTDQMREFGGVIFKEHRNDPAEDLLQFLFDSAYESEPGFKPTPGRLRQYLRDLVAVIVIDDLTLPQDELEVVRNSAPACLLLTASKQNRLFEGSSVFLTGLPDDAGLLLLERALGRPIRDDEREASATLVRALEGNPLLIRQAVSLIRLETADIPTLARRIVAGGARDLADESMATLPSSDLEVVQTLAVVGDIPIRASRVEELSGRPAQRILRELQERGIVEAQRQAYILADNVRQAADTALNRSTLSTFVDRAIGWIEREGGVVSSDDLPLLVSAIGWAADGGRWREVIQLCQGVETALIDSCRWGRWRWTMERAAAAARQLDDSSAVGWALHELGTLALCY